MPYNTKPRRGKQPHAGDLAAYTNPNPTFQQSKKWVAPHVQEDEKNKKLLDRKRIVCCAVESFFPDTVKKLGEHRREWAIFCATIKSTQIGTIEDFTSATQIDSQDTNTSSPPKIREPFNGILTRDGSLLPDHVPSPESFVLCSHTVFTPQHAMGPKAVADWPCKAEAKYEGDDRIATDVLHARFLGAPRVKGNATVNWQHRQIVKQYALEDFHQLQTEEFIWERNHWIGEVEFGSDWEGEVDLFGDGSGRDVVGWELFDAIDPVDRW